MKLPPLAKKANKGTKMEQPSVVNGRRAVFLFYFVYLVCQGCTGGAMEMSLKDPWYIRQNTFVETP